MYKKILVGELIEEGKALVQALKRKRFPMTAAVWYDFPDSEWRLVIASSSVEQKGPLAAYGVVQQALIGLQPEKLTLSDITLISPKGQDFQNLQSVLSIPSRSRHSVLAGHSPNLVFENAHIYTL